MAKLENKNEEKTSKTDSVEVVTENEENKGDNNTDETL